VRTHRAQASASASHRSCSGRSTAYLDGVGRVLILILVAALATRAFGSYQRSL
jgi:hypothetical protein